MKLIRLILFFLVTFMPLKAIEGYIAFKVNNEIITNIDLDTEYRYLIALNKELENTDKEVLIKLARESIIKEKIKKNEVFKYYELNSTETLLPEIIQNYYKRLNIKNLNDFEIYLIQNNLELEVVKKKIQIELLWNKLIGAKYTGQLNINEDFLKKQVEESSSNNEFVKEYELSEIIFQIGEGNNLINKVNLIQQDISELGFKTAANIHSLADSSKFGGSIGWFDEKQLSKKVVTILSNLEISELSEPIRVANNYMIIKIDNIKQKQIQLDKEKLLEKAILFEKNKQYNQFSIIYYNKVKLNSIISE
jgi:peptidyl-prolyl cis-trans isomerase SurA